MILKLLAKFLAIPAVTHWLVDRAMRTPYVHLEGYMMRWWLFNPYDNKTRSKRFNWCPMSIRVHHILREDFGRHHHNHPWDARTFILSGGYVEERSEIYDEELHIRQAGDTVKIGRGDFHSIKHVTPGGVWTLFVTFGYQGDWGFLMPNGDVVAHKEYLSKGNKP